MTKRSIIKAKIESAILNKKSEQCSVLENQESMLARYVKEGVSEALSEIRDKFENTEDTQNCLSYHNTKHTKDVIRRVETLTFTLNQTTTKLVTEQEINIAILAAAFHDVIQQWDVKHIITSNGIFQGFTKIMRERHSPDIEFASANKAVFFMEKINHKNTLPLFSDNDKFLISEAIKITIPKFDTAKGFITQPYLTTKTPLIARIVALADLGTAGMDGPEAFLSEVDALFREENIDISNVSKDLDNLTNDQKDYYRNRIIDWLKRELAFAEGRRNNLSDELNGAPDEAKQKISKLFTTFDESIHGIKTMIDRRTVKPFEKLLIEMGY